MPERDAGKRGASPVSRKSVVEAGYDWLLESSFLGRLDEATQDVLLERMCWQDYERGQVMVRQGASPSTVELVISGEVRAIDESHEPPEHVARLGPGDLAGERSVLLQCTASATVEAVSHVRTLRLSAAAFRELLDRCPDLHQRAKELVELRDRSALLLQLLSRHDFLRALGRDDLERLIQSGRVFHLRAGEALIRAGERSIDAYVVISGKLAVYAPSNDPADPGQRQLLSTFEPGALVGHAASLLDLPRTADVDAQTAVELLSLRATVLMTLIERNPMVKRRLLQDLAATNLHVEAAQRRTQRATVVSIFGAHPKVGTTTLAYGVAAALVRQGPVTLIDTAGPESAERLGLPMVADEIADIPVVRLETPPAWVVRVLWPRDLAQTLSLLKALQATQPAGSFVLLAARARDHVDVDAMHAADSVIHVRDGREGYHQDVAEPHQYRVDAVRVRSGVVLPLETSRNTVRICRDDASLDRFWHSASPDALISQTTSFGRACYRLVRVLTGRSVGVALGGGGALGYAHIGLLRALHAAGIPVDYISGVSFGAVVAGIYAAGGMPALDELLERKASFARRIWASCVSPAGIERFVDDLVGPVGLGETEIPFFPVGVDILTGREVVRSRGLVGHGTLSSCCLPPAFPALRIGETRVVDGGVSNNVPASVVWEAGAHFILASNIIPSFPFGPASMVKLPLPRGLRQIASRIEDTMRALYLLMSQTGRDRAELADYVFNLGIEGYNVLEFGQGDAIEAAGHEQAKGEIDAIEQAYRASTERG